VVHRVNRAFGTSFGVFEHTAENEARVFAAISERNRTRFDGAVTRERALILARPTAERDALKGRSDGYFNRWRPCLHARTVRRWEADVNRFGYSLLDLRRAGTEALPPPPKPNPA
jgi:hypothetical protein